MISKQLWHILVNWAKHIMAEKVVAICGSIFYIYDASIATGWPVKNLHAKQQFDIRQI